MTRITERGQRWLASIIGVLLLGLWIRDLILVAIAGIGLFYMVIKYYEVDGVAAAAKDIRIKPKRLSMSSVAGRESSKVVNIDSPRRYQVILELPGLRAEPGLVVPGGNLVELVYKPVVGGVNKLREVIFMVEDGYGLYLSTVSHRVRYTFTAYPRVFPLASNALGILSEMSLQKLEELPLYERRTRKLYEENEAYGSNRWINWNNRHSWSIENSSTTGVSVVFDGFADNLVCLDMLKSSFLELVLSFTQMGYVTQIKLLRIGESYTLERYDSLVLTVQLALQGHAVEFMGYYESIDPLTYRRGFAEKVLETPIYPSSVGSESDIRVIISSLSVDPVDVLETIESLDPRDTYLLVPEPWIGLDSIEGSRYSYRRHVKLVESVIQMGYRVYRTPRELMRELQARANRRV